MAGGYPDGMTAADIDRLVGESARIDSDDSAHDDPRNWNEMDRRRAIADRAMLMREAAWIEVAAAPPQEVYRAGSFYSPADPIGAWLSESAELYPSEQARIVRLMVRAMATDEGPARDALLAEARSAASMLAQDAARSRAWDLAEAVIDGGRS